MLVIIIVRMAHLTLKRLNPLLVKAKQTITLSGVNTHHQNGKMVRRISYVATVTRTSLLYASHCWLNDIYVSLWHLAMKKYVNLRNNIPFTYIKGEKIGRNILPDHYVNSPLSKFSGIETKASLHNVHPFRSLVHVLKKKLQAV